MDATRVIVVGNGMVGHRFCARLSERAAEGQFEIAVFGDEPRPAYDRVQLTSYFSTRDADSLSLASREWYAERGIELHVGERVVEIDRRRRCITTDRMRNQEYDVLVLATGSAAFIPPLTGIDKVGVFPYRTIEDLDSIMSAARRSKSCVVLGGGLLGLEAARAVHECGLETHVVELAPRLMPRQLDDVGARLLTREIMAMGVKVHVGKKTSALVGDERVKGLRFEYGERLDVDMVVVSAGIRPRDELARQSGLKVGPRGGIEVDDTLATSDPSVFAIGESALHRGAIYGLVGPGYAMADVLAKRLTGDDGDAIFEEGDCSTKLKLMGVDVATFGDPMPQGETREIALQDFVHGVYKKIVLDANGEKLLGGILVGDSKEYAQLCHVLRADSALPPDPGSLILGARGGAAESGVAALPDSAQICSCNNVDKAAICKVVREGAAATVSEVKACTTAGTGCGGCLPVVTDILDAELAARGQSVKRRICEHFDYTRQELFDLIRVKGIKTFSDLIASYGRGLGCEVCKPAAASVFASLHNEMILDRHATLQDTNDRFLANIQRRGLYSVIPRVPGGEITPDKLIALGEVAKKYGLYTKITGGQRIDLFGAHVNELPDIWQELVEAGFESGHAYGKAMRTVKSCVGTTWCRYGVQDSVAMAVTVELRYRGVRAPHKLKSAVSGCIRECAEAQSKDFGIIATEKGWNLYVCGNGGSKPRHADLLASDIDGETLIRYIDRFLMYYICTADKLTRTSVWVDKLEGGIHHVRSVVVDDSLGLGEELERMMQHLVDTYECEWKAVVENPALRARFKHFVNDEQHDDSIRFVDERGQRRPADWNKSAAPAMPVEKRRLPLVDRRWVRAGRVQDVPADGGISMKYGTVQLAIFNFASHGRWFATQNMCPHRQDMVLARGIVGDQGGEPKVACPLHKKIFSLEDGRCLSGEDFAISTFPVKVEDGEVYVELPPAEALAPNLCPSHQLDVADAAE